MNIKHKETQTNGTFLFYFEQKEAKIAKAGLVVVWYFLCGLRYLLFKLMN